MSEELEREGYDKVFLIGRTFTKDAREVMSQEGIEMASEKIMPSFKPQRLYVTIHNYIKHLCRAKCGHAHLLQRDGYTSLFRGSLRLNIGRYGKAEKVDREIGEVNTENNLSEKRYEEPFRYRPRRPFSRRRRTRY